MKSEFEPQKISSESVRLLMENIWLRHKAGMKQHPNKVYMVELPSPTPEEIAKMCECNDKDNLQDDEVSQK